MDPEVIPLIVEVVEERLETEVIAYKPAEEAGRFVLAAESTVMLIDETRNVFVPLNRGDSLLYLDMKKFLKELELDYRTRAEYRRF